MSVSFGLNWMTSSFIMYANLISLCKSKFEIENCNFLTKFVLIFFFFTLFVIIFPFEIVKACFLPISRKLAAVLLQNKIFEKSKRAAKTSDML